MIDWMTAQLLPLSMALLCLLVLRQGLNRLGLAQLSYLSWLLLPLLLLGSLLPASAISTPTVSHWIVTAQQQLAESTLTHHFINLWLLGSAIGSLWVLLTAWRFHQRCRLATPTQINGTAVHLLANVDAPLVFGLLAPRILLPTDFKQRYSKLEQRLIVAHEQRHIQRGDLVCNLIALGMLLLLWFNPLAWLGYRAFRQDQELACDADVLATQPAPARQQYCRALLKSQGSSQRYPAMLIQYGEKSMLKSRIQHSRQLVSVNRAIQILLAAFIAIAGINLSYAGNHSATTNKAPTPVMRIEPIYPQEAAANRLNGEVTLYFDIDSSGAVQNISVANSTPAGMFDAAAVDALKQWRYSPSANGAKQNGVVLEFVIDPTAEIERVKVVH